MAYSHKNKNTATNVPKDNKLKKEIMQAIDELRQNKSGHKSDPNKSLPKQEEAELELQLLASLLEEREQHE